MWLKYQDIHIPLLFPELRHLNPCQFCHPKHLKPDWSCVFANFMLKDFNDFICFNSTRMLMCVVHYLNFQQMFVSNRFYTPPTHQLTGLTCRMHRLIRFPYSMTLSLGSNKSVDVLRHGGSTGRHYMICKDNKCNVKPCQQRFSIATIAQGRCKYDIRLALTLTLPWKMDVEEVNPNVGGNITALFCEGTHNSSEKCNISVRVIANSLTRQYLIHLKKLGKDANGYRVAIGGCQFSHAGSNSYYTVSVRYALVLDVDLFVVNKVWA